MPSLTELYAKFKRDYYRLFNVKNNCSETISFWLSYYILDTKHGLFVHDNFQQPTLTDMC